jgi:hypothetical protein
MTIVIRAASQLGASTPSGKLNLENSLPKVVRVRGDEVTTNCPWLVSITNDNVHVDGLLEMRPRVCAIFLDEYLASLQSLHMQTKY